MVAAAVGSTEASSLISARAVETSLNVMPPPSWPVGSAIVRTAAEQPVTPIGGCPHVPVGTVWKSSLTGTAVTIGLD